MLNATLARLESLGDERVRAHNEKRGAGRKQFGVRLGTIRKVAKDLKPDHPLAFELWDTENTDARLLAILLLKPREVAPEELDRLVRTVNWSQVADWLMASVIKRHPHREALRLQWMDADVPMAQRAGWALTAQRIAKHREGLDLDALLDRIEAELSDAHPDAQWTMNMALVEIGIHVPELRPRALAIGERLGVYRDYPVSKGCTSPYAPEWIGEMLRRKR